MPTFLYLCIYGLLGRWCDRRVSEYKCAWHLAGSEYKYVGRISVNLNEGVYFRLLQLYYRSEEAEGRVLAFHVCSI